MEDDGPVDMKSKGSRGKDQLDINDVLRFVRLIVSFAETVAPVVVGFGLLIFYIIIVYRSFCGISPL